MDEDLKGAVSYTDEELEFARQFAVMIQWSPEDQVFIAQIPQLPGAVTHGTTPAEAADMATEAAALWIRTARLSGEAIPSPEVPNVDALHSWQPRPSPEGTSRMSARSL
jgi:predicted RNase H-like HicB family nuclease